MIRYLSERFRSHVDPERYKGGGFEATLYEQRTELQCVKERLWIAPIQKPKYVRA